jgi:uncharacterized protein (TIGR03792 family)
MVIEMQRIRVDPERREEWLAADEEVWTRGLSGAPGFLGKEVWQGEDGELVLVIRWRSREDWDAVPKPLLDRLDRELHGRLSTGWELVGTSAYEVVREAAGR